MEEMSPQEDPSALTRETEQSRLSGLEEALGEKRESSNMSFCFWYFSAFHLRCLEFCSKIEYK